MSILTDDHLSAFIPGLVDVPQWTGALNAAMDRFDVTSTERIAAFLAQVAHESSEFQRLIENLNYSAKRLMQVWPGRFSSLEKAMAYANQPEKLANYVYAKRLGNGDVGSGDGWQFRGRGLLQITGRGNYQSTGAALGLPLDVEPDLLAEPTTAAMAAAQFWKSRGLNELADDRNDDNDDEDFVTISVIINGGREGLASRQMYWARAKVALGLT
jgi:putative chitinase